MSGRLQPAQPGLGVGQRLQLVGDRVDHAAHFVEPEAGARRDALGERRRLDAAAVEVGPVAAEALEERGDQRARRGRVGGAIRQQARQELVGPPAEDDPAEVEDEGHRHGAVAARGQRGRVGPH